MDIRDLQRHWDDFGQQDPLWAILTEPGKAAGAWDAEAFFRTGREEIAQVFRVLDRLQLRVPSGKALDFGCGVGRLSQALAEHFEEVVGVDIAPSMIAGAERFNRFGPRVSYLRNDRNDLSLFGDGAFTFIYSNITLQHMRPRYARAYLREFVRVLQPGGILVFQLPARNLGTSPGGWFYRVAARLDHDRGAALAQRVMRGLRPGYHGPVMEMYGTTPRQLQGWLRGQPVRFVQIRRNSGAGDLWESYRYVLRKED